MIELKKEQIVFIWQNFQIGVEALSLERIYLFLLYLLQFNNLEGWIYVISDPNFIRCISIISILYQRPYGTQRWTQRRQTSCPRSYRLYYQLARYLGNRFLCNYTGRFQIHKIQRRPYSSWYTECWWYLPCNIRGTSVLRFRWYRPTYTCTHACGSCYRSFNRSWYRM